MGNVILNDWLEPGRRPQVRRPMVRARYDAAQLDDDNRRHWANADALSAKQANSIDVRSRLRNHSRYEVANNCYARGVGNTLADIVIGYGPTLTFRQKIDNTPAESEALRKTAELFNDWAGDVDLWGKLWLMRLTKYQDGEAFAIFRNNPRLPGVELDLQLIEAEQVSTGYMSMDTFDPKKVDGIETDDFGNPVTYHVLTEHPGDGVSFDARDTEVINVPASQIIHWFRRDRPGQLRGIPETTPALPLFAQLRRFTLAVLTAAETAADFAAVIKSNITPDEDDGQTEPFETIEINRGLMTTLPDGYDIGQLKAEHPTTTYEQFKTQILCEVGRALQLPKSLVLLDSSGYNYSSGRLDKQGTDRMVEVEQYQCELHVLAKIFEAWFFEARRIAGYLPQEIENGIEVRPRWLWRKLGHVDRKKEADGAAAELANNTTTLAAECAANGEDWEEVLLQRAAELSRIRELGLVTVQTGAKPQGNGNDATDENSGEESVDVEDDVASN